MSKRPDAGEGVIDVAAGPSGTIWATTEATAGMGVLSSSGGKWAPYVVPGFDGSKVGSHTLFMDREHSLWIGTTADGLYRVHDGIAEHYGTADGLSGNDINFVYEDHEGNIWVVTNGGIDMFRDTAVVTYSTREGLSNASILSVLGLRDGSLWMANGGVIDILKDGRHSVLPAKGTFDEQVTALFEDRKGIVWVGHENKLFAYGHDRFQEIKRADGSKLEGGMIVAITDDTKGDIWVLTEHHYLFRVENGSVLQILTASGDNRASGTLASDHQGGIWIASQNDTLTYYKDGSAQTISLNRPDSSFSVSEIIVDSDDALLVATTDGLFRWGHQRWQVLDSHNGLPSNLVYSVLRDNDGAVWVRCQKGLARISAPEFDKWRHQSDSKPVMQVFDRFDGARSGRGSFMIQSPATKTADGRLWFVAGAVVQMIDPKQTFQNGIQPPVHIEQVVADRTRYSPRPGLRLPRLLRDLEVDYSALSFVAPQKVRFRYKLEGRDADWQEPGTRRQAFYSDLNPGNYRFRVIACNNDGLWNEDGATLEFSVAPAWYQRNWFRVACAATLLMLLYLLYQLRLRQLHHQFSIGLEARVNERTRIARELHDTLLQSFQGLMLRFQTVDEMLPARPMDAKKALEGALERADQAISEGRDAITDIRTSTLASHDLAKSITTLMTNLSEELAASSRGSVTFRVLVEGAPRTVHPILQDEIYRIARESLRNAFRHAQARNIETEITYGESLRIRFRDDGRGIDTSTIEHGGRSGHWGLPGIRERAKQIGAQMEVWSELGAGTEVELSVPGSIAYEVFPTKARFRLFRKRTEQHHERRF
jgi:signal transduction histidine kinase/streptogramin lyase